MEIETANNSMSTFEQNGFSLSKKQYWWASWYSQKLDYSTLKSFMTPIHKAMQACLSMDINIEHNFSLVGRVIDEHHFEDYRLSRFACYLIAMNADIKKPEVVLAQKYFHDQIEKTHHLLKDKRGMDRVLIRKEIKSCNKQLNKAASKSGVKDYRDFTNKGYLGLYNKSLKELKVERHIPANESIFDYTGQVELATNLLRIILTENLLKRKNNLTAEEATKQHYLTARSIRHLIKENLGKYPEELPTIQNLHQLSKDYKKIFKVLKKAQ